VNALWLRLAVGILLAGTAALAEAASPVGLWRTIDDATGKERSLIRISEANGDYQGKVEKIFERPGDDPKHLCKKCEDERKDKPIIGMTILWGLKQQGKEFSGGKILDPDNGKTYRCKMKLSDDGKELEVRGYIGISLIGRSQTWHREQ
jgi:uncharacterized protein (DUF2147 family)